MARIFKPEVLYKKYPACKIKICPFCGCMDDNTCKIENVAEESPQLINEFAELINYCDRPKEFANKVKEESDGTN